MPPSANSEPMDSVTTLSLSMTGLSHIHYSSSALPVLDGMLRGGEDPELVEKVTPPYEVRTPPLLPSTRPPMPIRPSLCCCPSDIPAAAARTGCSGDSYEHTNLNPHPETESTDAFSDLRSLSAYSKGSQSTRPSTPNQLVSDDTQSSSGLGTGISVAQSLEEHSPSNLFLGFFRSLFSRFLGFCQSLLGHSSYLAYRSFLRAYPEYKLTWPIDTLRKREYRRLKRSGEVYVDYMGAALYPESLVHSNSTFLCQTILGNTHSFSASSHQSAICAEEARSSVLEFFDAPSSEYTVVFTSNATGAMRLVGESFPFVQGSSFVLGMDSHNSVNGIRRFALDKGARVAYIVPTPQGGMDELDTKSTLMAHRPKSPFIDSPCLFALTGLSNVTNSKNPLSFITHASSLGYYTFLDAAALAPSSRISLRAMPVDGMAVSFYKMFGFPTGVGCLVAKKSFLRQLKRPWFAGGTVDVVQVPGAGFTAAQEIYEQFEDGTINFASLFAVTRGLSLLSQYIDYLPLRLSILAQYLAESLTEIKHDVTDTLIARIVSRRPGKRLLAVGEQSEAGSTVSLVFLGPSGEIMSNSFVEYAATKNRISLRTGCMCNPGGAAAILGVGDEMEKFYPGITYEDFESIVGRELGVVRLSLGLVSDFSDVHRLLRFAREVIACDVERKKLWEEWEHRRQSHT